MGRRRRREESLASLSRFFENRTTISRKLGPRWAYLDRACSRPPFLIILGSVTESWHYKSAPIKIEPSVNSLVNKKWLFRGLALWGLLILPSLFGLRGCGTQPLYDSALRADGPVDQYSEAFLDGNKIIVSYSTQARQADNYTLPPSHYWAEVTLDANLREMKQLFKIHREPFSETRFANLPHVPIEDVTKTGRRNSHGYIQTDYVEAYLSTLPHSAFPRITYWFSGPAGNDGTRYGSTYFTYYDPAQNKLQSITDAPYGVYIPISEIPRLLAFWPFAALMDWITLPLLIRAPHIEG
jgi:hypothetical protein